MPVDRNRAGVSEGAIVTEGRPLADACRPGEPCLFGDACHPERCSLAVSCRYSVVIPGVGHSGHAVVPAEDLDQVRQVLEEQDPQGRAWACDRQDPAWRLGKADL